MDVLYLRTLINERINGSFKNQIYEKDATSSGLQIISILLLDPLLAQKLIFLVLFIKIFMGV